MSPKSKDDINKLISLLLLCHHSVFEKSNNYVTLDCFEIHFLDNFLLFIVLFFLYHIWDMVHYV